MKKGQFGGKMLKSIVCGKAERVTRGVRFKKNLLF